MLFFNKATILANSYWDTLKNCASKYPIETLLYISTQKRLVCSITVYSSLYPPPHPTPTPLLHVDSIYMLFDSPSPSPVSVDNVDGNGYLSS